MTLKKKAAEAVEKVHEVHPVGKVKSLGKYVPKAVTVRQGRAVLKLQKHSPAILFGVGVTAGVATVVTACKQTLKLDSVLSETESDLHKAKSVLKNHPEKYSVKDYNKDVAVIRVRTIVRIGRLYAVPAGLGVLSVAALTGSHHILNKRNVALTAAYSTLDKGFKDYRARVTEEVGEDKERELRHGVQERTVTVETKDGKTKKQTSKFFADANSPYARVYDELSARNWKPNPHTNRMNIQVQQNWANDLLQARGHVFLNEVYDMLGLDRSKEGQVVGWVLGNGDDYIDFGIMTRTSEERVHEFMFGTEASVLLDFNVDGNVLDLI